MNINKEYLTTKFKLFNEQYFNGKLPEPRFVICDARSYLGQFRHIRKRSISPFRRHKDFYTIKISTHYEMSKRELLNVLLHEMIHFHIDFNGLRDDAPHGKMFRKEMETLNNRYGWDIRISVRKKEGDSAKKSKPEKRLVLAFKTTDSRFYLTVVNPKYRTQIEERIKTAGNISKTRWFESKSPYFSDFPAVRTLRAVKVNESTYQNALKNKATEAPASADIQ